MEPPALRAILEEAERAAVGEDYATAARLLQQAAGLQEAGLGAQHPELANTFNNLGVAYERAGQPAQAEASYRRACAIVAAALTPDDPLALTSRQNLADFCAAHDRPLELVAAASSPAASTPASGAPKPSVVPLDTVAHAPAPAAPAPVEAAPRPAVVSEQAGASEQPRETASESSRARVTTTAPPRLPPPAQTPSRVRLGPVLLLAGVVAVAAYVALARLPGPEPAATRPAEPPPPAQPAGAEPRPSPVTPPVPAAVETSEPTRTVTPRAAPRMPAPTTADGVTVVDAKLCRPLTTPGWRCTPASNPARPGVFAFYTRLRANRDTSVQHRWYFEDRLLRTVTLRVSANQSEGYRTFSRNTISAERTGNWRIELRDAKGTVLHEERLTVN
jgi:hypothetical protein